MSAQIPREGFRPLHEIQNNHKKSARENGEYLPDGLEAAQEILGKLYDEKRVTAIIERWGQEPISELNIQHTLWEGQGISVEEGVETWYGRWETRAI